VILPLLWGGGRDRLAVFLKLWRSGRNRLTVYLMMWRGGIDRLAVHLVACGGGGGGDRLTVFLQTWRGGRYWLGMVRVLMASQSLVCFTGLELTCHKITQMTVE
jgi:hypothetical protein